MSSSISIIKNIINFIHIINQTWNVPNHASLYLLLVLASHYLVHTCPCIMNCFIRASSVLGLTGTPEQGLWCGAQLRYRIWLSQTVPSLAQYWYKKELWTGVMISYLAFANCSRWTMFHVPSNSFYIYTYLCRCIYDFHYYSSFMSIFI